MGINAPPRELIPALSAGFQQQPCLYRQPSQCHEAFTHTISRPQRGQELSAVVVGAVRSPALQTGVGGGDCTPPPYSPGRMIDEEP